MGMYVCKPCADRFGLKTDKSRTRRSICDSCTALYDDWTGNRLCMFTDDLRRLGRPVHIQLRNLGVPWCGIFPPPPSAGD